MDSTQQLQSQATQQNNSSVQQPRNDLQPTGSNLQQGGSSTPQASEALTQDGLSAPQLRVGDSGTTVTNTTKTTVAPATQPMGADYSWLWLMIPVLIAIVLFWPQRRKAAVVQPEPTVPPASLATKPQTQPKKKSKKSKKRARR
jgi:hypothetical protein